MKLSMLIEIGVFYMLIEIVYASASASLYLFYKSLSEPVQGNEDLLTWYCLLVGHLVGFDATGSFKCMKCYYGMLLWYPCEENDGFL